MKPVLPILLMFAGACSAPATQPAPVSAPPAATQTKSSAPTDSAFPTLALSGQDRGVRIELWAGRQLHGRWQLSPAGAWSEPTQWTPVVSRVQDVARQGVLVVLSYDMLDYDIIVALLEQLRTAHIAKVQLGTSDAD